MTHCYNWRIATYCLFAMMIILAPSIDANTELPTSQRQTALIQPVDVPLASASATLNANVLDSISAQSFLVLDEASGSVLVEKNSQLQLLPASTTKLMTALVARETYYLTQVVTVREEAFSEGNVVGLQPGETISINQLLQALLIRSGNDAAFVLANNHPDGYQGFIDAMNQKAVQLGLDSASFRNASGLDDYEQAVTARDLSIIAREVARDPVLANIMKTDITEVTDTSGLLSREVGSTHQLLYTDPTVVGGKTGTTQGAGQVLVTFFERPDSQGQIRRIQVVVMNSQDRYADTLRLIEFVMNKYQWQSVQL